MYATDMAGVYSDIDAQNLSFDQQAQMTTTIAGTNINVPATIHDS
jgi:hypothetical protein